MWQHPSVRDFAQTGTPTFWCVRRVAEFIAGILSQQLIFSDCWEVTNQFVGRYEFNVAILKLLMISCNEDDDDVNRVGRIKAIVLLHAMMASAECRLVIHLLLPP